MYEKVNTDEDPYYVISLLVSGKLDNCHCDALLQTEEK
jgi:hypothetical protein